MILKTLQSIQLFSIQLPSFCQDNSDFHRKISPAEMEVIRRKKPFISITKRENLILLECDGISHENDELFFLFDI